MKTNNLVNDKLRKEAQLRNIILEIIRRPANKIYLEDEYYDILETIVNVELKRKNIPATINFTQDGDMMIYPQQPIEKINLEIKVGEPRESGSGKKSLRGFRKATRRS